MYDDNSHYKCEKVLIAGGDSSDDLSAIHASTELYDQSIRLWTNTGYLNIGRTCFAASILPDGKLLISGGYDGVNLTASAELYDSLTGRWINTTKMSWERWWHTLSQLTDVNVLALGGDYHFEPSTCELYNTSTGLWEPTGRLN
ncbi:unnamed protein product [Rotaria socialis]|uniref:Uncharacterized protein n=1 Tax=Rotaria socialis TaxID=392032 RepID=A0A821S057_9BILA|nr:unnamed protein product [Rotaria socialis]